MIRELRKLILGSLVAIDKILKKEGLSKENISLTYSIGDYSITITREINKHLDFIFDIPIDLFLEVGSLLINIKDLWKDKGDEKEVDETINKYGYTVIVMIDGDMVEETSWDDLVFRKENFEKSLKEAIKDENFEEAQEIKECLDNIKSKIREIEKR